MICEQWGTCIEECVQNGKPTKCCNHRKHVEKCILSCDKRSRVTCSDQGKTYTILNSRNKLAINYQMDGGIIKPDKKVPVGVKKCDNVVVFNGSTRIAVLVELKGVQVSDGISQLYETYDRFRDLFSTFNRIYARCVTNRRIPPDLRATPNYRKLISAIGKRGNYKSIRAREEEMDTDF